MPLLHTRPDSIEVAFHRSAIVVVDMQNAFASKGLVPDATMQAGDQSLYAATLHNVESFFGWTITSENLVAGLMAQAIVSAHVDS